MNRESLQVVHRYRKLPRGGSIGMRSCTSWRIRVPGMRNSICQGPVFIRRRETVTRGEEKVARRKKELYFGWSEVAQLVKGRAKKSARRMGESHQQPQQQQPLLRSINNVYVSLVKFINKTMHNVVLYWIDYQGQAVSYGVLSPGDCLDIDTFVTHPWIFVDQETRDRYTVNQKDVFFPEPSPLLLVRQGGRRAFRFIHQHDAPQRCERTNVFITLPVYTLRELCLRAIKRRLTHDRQAFQLDIPRSLQYELATMLPRNEEDDNARNS